VLQLHRGGKVEMVSRIRLRTVDDLRRAYTPGVAHVSRLIQRDPAHFWDYTWAGNTIAIVTNGTAVLGLGDIGVRAALPVMEGKAAIMMEMADISAVPILVESDDADSIVETTCRIAPTFGGILLEDIAAPLCFDVEEALKRKLEIPVFHDDQHGTAVVVLAALINALKKTGKTPENLRVVINGAGAAGHAVSRFLLNYGVADVVLCDRAGAIYRGRTERMNPAKEAIAQASNKANEGGTLGEVMRNKDVFIGLSVAGVVNREMVRSMRTRPIVFAMANPVPEIWPHEATEAGAAVAEHGRNINNALGFPGLFRGALDARATGINEEMKLAAAARLAALAPEGGLVPDFMDRNVHREVARAVAEAARTSGAARI